MDHEHCRLDHSTSLPNKAVQQPTQITCWHSPLENLWASRISGDPHCTLMHRRESCSIKNILYLSSTVHGCIIMADRWIQPPVTLPNGLLSFSKFTFASLRIARF